jgi:transposase
MHRHELTDAQYALVEPYMPKTGPMVVIPGPSIAAS